MKKLQTEKGDELLGILGGSPSLKEAFYFSFHQCSVASVLQLFNCFLSPKLKPSSVSLTISVTSSWDELIKIERIYIFVSSPPKRYFSPSGHIFVLWARSPVQLLVHLHACIILPSAGIFHLLKAQFSFLLLHFVVYFIVLFPKECRGSMIALACVAGLILFPFPFERLPPRLIYRFSQG